MYKLAGHGLTRGTFFLPESQGMTLGERDSTSVVQLDEDAPEISFNDWLLDDRWPEGDYVWRVKSMDDTVTGRARQITLEHVIRSLEDVSLFGEAGPKEITGSSSATTCTAKQAFEYILGKQSDWTLGDFEYNVSNP